ncbi:hypothetical protein [Fluviicola taffensis]|uniref:hypothetical protein n=1 Tax=Fluviicola taffensis TaxID=191579 RepID=UPI0031382001
MQKPILLTSILVVLFFFIMWLIFPLLNDALMKQLIDPAMPFKITVSSMNEEFTIRLKTALSFGVLPLLSFGFFQLVRRTKNPDYPNSKLILILMVVCFAYLVGFLIKFILILLSFGVIASEPLASDVASDIPLNQIYFYDYALVCSLIAGLFIWVFARKKKSDSN